MICLLSKRIRWFWPLVYVFAAVAEVAGRMLPMKAKEALMRGHTKDMVPNVRYSQARLWFPADFIVNFRALLLMFSCNCHALLLCIPRLLRTRLLQCYHLGPCATTSSWGRRSLQTTQLLTTLTGALPPLRTDHICSSRMATCGRLSPWSAPPGPRALAFPRPWSVDCLTHSAWASRAANASQGGHPSISIHSWPAITGSKR